jgi:hypothetical protein
MILFPCEFVPPHPLVEHALQRLEAEDLQQRRIRWLATKALIVIRQLNDVAEPKLKSMDWSSRDSWQRNYSFIESILEKIKKRGA